MPKGKTERQRKEKRMAVTNIKVTPEAHNLLKTIADTLGMPMSDAIIFLITERFPNAEEMAKARDEYRTQLAQRRPSKRSGSEL